MLRETPLWAEPGHVVASMQLPLQLPSGASQGSLAQRLLQRQGLAEAGFLAAAAGGAGGEGEEQAPKIEETPELLTLHCRGGEVAVRISRTSGCMSGITLKGRQLLEGELQPCLFRACTDNDRGGTKGSSYAARWLDAGLDRMERAGACTLETETKGGVTTVRTSWTMKPRQLSKEEAEARASKASGAGVGESGGSHWFAEVETLDEGGEQAPAAAEGDGRGAGAPSGTGPAQQGNGKEAGEGAEQAGSAEGEVKVEVVYTVHGASGLVESAWSVDAQRALPAPLPAGLTHSLPRVGITAPLSGALSDLTYYGRGPHENYMDRKYGAHMGLYTVSAPESRCPYVFPQEYGGREDVQWLLLRAPAHPSKPSAAKEGGGEGVAAAAAATAEGGEAGPSAMEVETEPKTAEPEPGKEEKDTEPKAAEPEPGKEKEGETAPTEGGSKTEAAGGEVGPGERKEEAETGAAAKEEASKEAEAKTEERGAKTEAAPPAAAAAGAALAVFPTPVDSSAAFHMSASPFSMQALQEATHDCDLVPSGLTHLHLDHRHMGVGGDDRVALLPCQCI
ncbi:hypothetical protein DUNSADRAFT_12579 [Dunaliella salina]|uniref:beta-galactosidase n=1 Tax=Dunaliella salina TaxID=3046 RepID=A0ABQ7GB18_DUNSA|nr:hypothetical protein DUNSADRAFT_12579 [Dunaliella salina]|eukprot:KAF5831793.1 hypothetical protein DUNSADRAFT_12579 [Dunaliella salina]